MVNRLLQKLLLEQEEVDVRERYRKAGELLKYNLLKVEKGQRSAELVDFDGKSVRVDLDPKLSPRENMEYCFQKYRKLNKKEKVLLEKVRRENSRLRYILDQKQRISKERLIGSSGSLAQFFGSLDVSLLGKSFLRRTKQLGVKSASKMRRTDERYFTLTSQTGKNILIGRNAEENDELLRKVARGNDLWFHVESGQGSHVFLRYDKRGQFREEDVRDASLLALYFSKLRNEKKGNVVYTYCKYVQRPKGARTGRVIYRNHKTRFVTEHKGDLKRLLNAETSLVE
jgi:predicted ribosome quality control (RQC) complex YloA/Tae2 family protein